MYHYTDHDWGNGHPWLMLIFGLLFLAVIVGLVVWAIVRMSRPHPGSLAAGPPAGLPRPDAALEALRMRYARGEIDRETFARMAADLGGPPNSGPPPSS
ncbi:MAG: SHOCT domain-containing protein [Acidimicrobiia bacterium]